MVAFGSKEGTISMTLKGSLMAFVKLATVETAAVPYQRVAMQSEPNKFRCFVRFINIDWDALLA